MCGIAGVLFTEPRAPIDVQRIVGEMCGGHASRGPDGVGIWTDGRVGLGSVRLAITGGTVAGAQPMSVANSSVIGLMNGEIYNAAAFAEGVHPHCSNFSDTSVALARLHAHGPSCLREFRGPFAIALYQPDRGKLLLTRDFFGKKPLYITRQPGLVAFASTLNALRPVMRHFDVRDEAVYEYLLFKSIGADNSALQEVEQLPAAGWMEIGFDGATRGGSWCGLPDGCDLDPDADEARAMVDESVALRVPNDHPPSIFLSGGLDSSIVAHSVASQFGPKAATAISVGYDMEGSEDETDYARMVAESLGMPFAQVRVEAEDVPELLEAAATFTEDPIQDPVTVPTVVLARAAAKSGKVVLTGDGSDEIWGGYERFADLPGTLSEYYPRTMLFTPEEVGLRRAPDSYFVDAERFVGLPVFDQVLRAEAMNRLKNYHLTRVDKIIAGFAVEPRCPFLDRTLAHWALRIPAAKKRRNNTPKGLLIDAFADLPTWLRARQKQPFTVPIAAWLLGPLRDFAMDTLASNKARTPSIVDYEVVWRDLETATGQRRLYPAHKIWSLLQLEVWFDAFLGAKRGVGDLCLVRAS